MLQNYFKVAWRNLIKNKTFSAINIFGLAIGIAAFLLIVNYLRFEYSFDGFNTKEDRIFRVPMTITETGGKEQTFAFTYPALAPALKKDYPEVEEAVRFRRVWGVVSHGDKKFIENGQVYYVDPSIFNVFTLNFEKGSKATAFQGLNDAVITHSTATKYFGNEDPVGKPLRYREEDYIVSAVLDDVPANSHIQFNILLNFNKYIQLTQGASNTSWTWSDFYTYLLLKPGTKAEALQARMPGFADRYLSDRMKKDGFKISFQIQPLKDIHTRSAYAYEMAGSGNLYYLKYLGWAALLILCIALVNYINLSTARSLERSKEVGLRKVVGATRPQLIRQFLIESLLLNAFGIILGFALFKLSLPSFARLIGREVADLQVYDSRYWISLLLIFVVSTLLAGFYPSFILSSFQPIQSIKSFSISGGKGQGKAFLRRSLVVFQFTAAIVLIGGALGFYRQMRFMSNKDLGVNIKQTLVLQQTVNLDSSRSNSVELLIHQLQAIPGVQMVTASTSVPGADVGSSTTFKRLNAQNDKRTRVLGVDEKFVPNYGLSVLAGRNFDKDKAASDDTAQIISILLNETAAKTLGFASPAEAINQRVEGAGHHCRVIGVINDYHQQSLQYDFDPIVFYPEQHVNMTNFALKLETGDLSQVIEKAKSTWNGAFPQSPLQFFFLDEYFSRQYKNDQLFVTILWLFTILAIVVASLGLLGLSLYTVAKRLKEISIRKVLGANVLQITALITKDYIKLIICAGVIATPVAYFLLQNWLKGYAFHIEIGYLFLLLPVSLILVIALLTVLYQSLKAALSNPARNLRTE
ncbi:MAG TPA: ABC transporter permease [Puia sp.]|nr:ABC transporter permease [Puia sp.]